MNDQEWQGRIEKKLDQVLEQTGNHRETIAKHGADIAWIKGIVGALGSFVSAAAAYLWRKSS